jgi:hypothetical protein
MSLQQLKIGYWPYHASLNVPGDRRRFVFYANERKINFEIASTEKQYDVVYLTTGCDITAWLRYKKKHSTTKIIFELIDSYLLEDLNLFGLLRGPSRFLGKKESGLYLNYRQAILLMVQKADAVVCSTTIQRDFMLPLNNNIHISLDYFENDILSKKKEYSVTGKLKLAWEGQAYTVNNLLCINPVLEKLKDKVELHIITDPVAKFPLKIFNKKTETILKKLKCSWLFYEWERKNFTEIIAGTDLAIIPINQADKLMWNKPENKLLLLWQIEIPVLTSATPAYTRVMQNAGINMCCNTTEDWVKHIERFANLDSAGKNSIVESANNYIASTHTMEKICKNWDAIFASVI